MWEDLDIDALEKADKEKEALNEQYGKYGDDEVLLAQLRKESMQSSLESNTKNLERIEQKLSEMTDEENPLSGAVKEVATELEEAEKAKQSTEDNTSNDENEANDGNEENNEPEANVESEAATQKEEVKTTSKETEDLVKANAEKDELIKEIFKRLDAAEKAKELAKQEALQEFEEKARKEQAVAKKKLTTEEAKSKVKQAVEKMNALEDESASDLLTEVILSLTEPNEPVNKPLSKEEFKKYQAEYQAEIYAEQFESEKVKFFSTEEGKKILNDEDMFDVYKTKLNRLQNSGELLNPGDLFKSAYEKTASVFKLSQPTSNPANKSVPKIADSLKEDVSKAEETKRQAVKPSSSSNVAKATENKTFNQEDFYNDYIERITGKKLK